MMLHMTKISGSNRLATVSGLPTGVSLERCTSSMAVPAPCGPGPHRMALKTPCDAKAGEARRLPVAAHRPVPSGVLRLAGSIIGVAVLFDLQTKPIYAADVGRAHRAKQAEPQIQISNRHKIDDWASAMEFVELAGPAVTLSFSYFRISRQIDRMKQKLTDMAKPVDQRLFRSERQPSGTGNRLEQQIGETDQQLNGIEKRLKQQIGGLQQQQTATEKGLEQRMDGLDKRIDELSSEVKSLRADVITIGRNVSFLQGVRSAQEKRGSSRTGRP